MTFFQNMLHESHVTTKMKSLVCFFIFIIAAGIFRFWKRSYKIPQESCKIIDQSLYFHAVDKPLENTRISYCFCVKTVHYLSLLVFSPRYIVLFFFRSFTVRSSRLFTILLGSKNPRGLLKIKIAFSPPLFYPIPKMYHLRISL